MKIRYLLWLVSILLLSTTQTQAQLGNLLKDAENVLTGKNGEGSGQIGLGLKEALENGVNDAVASLAKENGYYDSPYKILLPKEAQMVTDKLQGMPGFSNLEQQLTKKMNEAAEIAVEKAGPIFLNSIKSITFKDAMAILSGEPDAATRYLEDSARDELYSEFMPVIQSALDEVHIRDIWNKAATSYAKIPFIGKEVNPNLDDHVNNKALDGVFSLIQQKENGIRADVSQRTSPLLQEVFAQQD